VIVACHLLNEFNRLDCDTGLGFFAAIACATISETLADATFSMFQALQSAVPRAILQPDLARNEYTTFSWFDVHALCLPL
jgi:hypothetical protein